MSEALDLVRKAEALIAEGDADVGMPMLLSALDVEPDLFEGLEALGIAAIEDDRWRDELFARLRRAVERAATAESRRRALWFQVTHGAFFDRIDLVRSVARVPEDLISHPGSQAAVGALLVELGEPARPAQIDEGRRLIAESAAPLGEFHLARFEAAASDFDAARRRLLRLATRGEAGLVREAGLALLALDEGREGAAAEARSLAARVETAEDAPGPHLASEILFLKLRAAQVDGKPRDAAWAAEQLGMPPHDHDPGVMLRARALLGPLHLLRNA